jgi:HEAT repeat protein
VHGQRRIDPAVRARAWEIVQQLGGGTDTEPGGNDADLSREMIALGADALPALIEGLTFPPGFADKRALCCQLLGKLGKKEAAPFLAAALRDPVPAVTEWACWALESCGDEDNLPQLRSYQDRVPALVGADRGADRGDGPEAPADHLLARAARTRLMLGDDSARDDLVNMLLSRNADARKLAIEALRLRFGDTLGYDADAGIEARAAAAQRWRKP